MSYTISAESLTGAVTLHRDDAQAAAKKARELDREGMWNVRVDAQDPPEAAASEPSPQQNP